MYKNQHKILGLILIITDCAIFVLSMIVAGFLRYESIPVFFENTAAVGLLIVTLFSGIVAFYFVKMFQRFFIRGHLDEVLHVAALSFLLLLFITLYTFGVKNRIMLSRLTLLYFFGINTVLLYFVHLLIKKAHARHVFGSRGSKLLIITDIENVALTCQNIYNSHWIDKAMGVILIDQMMVNQDQLSGIPLITLETDCADYIIQNTIDEVLLSVTEDRFHSDEIKTLITKIKETGAILSIKGWLSVNEEAQVYKVKEFKDFYVISFANREYDYITIIAKRAMDILGGLIGSIIAIVVSIFVAPAILLESRGPLFFRQVRVGRNGRNFTILKFRSMYADAESRKKQLLEKNKMNGPMFKVKDDPRITRVGKFIRKTSIDELPQFFNILVGNMSLVGIRPPTLDEYKKYTCAQKKRLSFRPGLTGLWQTSGRSNITDFSEVMEMDLQYIRDWSVYLDIKLILKTLVTVMIRKGAE